MSRTIKFAHAGGPEVLEFIETEVPAPGPHEVRIEVKAIGINRADSMWRNDKYVESPIFPAGLGYDCAGVVDAVGKDVTDFAVGDTVSTIPAFSLNKYFTYGEVILAPDHAVVKHPESLSFVEAASVWMMFITAYGALVVDAHVKADDFVIIPAASSSIGLAAIQIANHAGATPIALTRTCPCRKPNGWRLTENRTMLICNERSFQAHCLGGCRSVSVASSDRGRDLDVAAADNCSATNHPQETILRCHRPIGVRWSLSPLPSRS